MHKKASKNSNWKYQSAQNTILSFRTSEIVSWKSQTSKSAFQRFEQIKSRLNRLKFIESWLQHLSFCQFIDFVAYARFLPFNWFFVDLFFSFDFVISDSSRGKSDLDAEFRQKYRSFFYRNDRFTTLCHEINIRMFNSKTTIISTDELTIQTIDNVIDWLKSNRYFIDL